MVLALMRNNGNHFVALVQQIKVDSNVKVQAEFNSGIILMM